MSTQTAPTAARSKEQIGNLAYEIFQAIKAADFTYDELVHFGHSVYSKIDIGQLRSSAKDPKVGVGVLTKLFKLAELLDGKFPLPTPAPTASPPVEPPAPIAPAVSNGHPTHPSATELIAKAVAGAPPVTPDSAAPGAQESAGG